MRHKLALTIALAVLMAVVAGASLAAAESQVSAGAGTGSGQPTTPAAPPVVAPGTPIGGGVEAAPPLQGTITGATRQRRGRAADRQRQRADGADTERRDRSRQRRHGEPPSTSFTPIGPAPLGVPNFLIDSFEIPPFLLPIYQACGTQYDIPWQVLASINKIESAFGTNLNVSSAGAMGWMQFIPSTWAAYGVDANGDGRKDPYNPVDAICAAARYLRAAGGESDLYNAIFAYNHADWYVQEVLLYARGYGKLPEQLVGSLTGLTEGAHFPVAADARYSDAISTEAAAREAKPTPGAAAHNAAQVVGSAPGRTGIDVYSKPDAPVVAVNDGEIKAIGSSPQLGRYIVLQDAYGNRYTYGNLGEIVRDYPVPKPQPLSAADFKLITPAKDKKPTAPATKTTVKENALNTAAQPGRPESEGPGPKAPDADTGSGTGPSAAAPAPDATGAAPADATARAIPPGPPPPTRTRAAPPARRAAGSAPPIRTPPARPAPRATRGRGGRGRHAPAEGDQAERRRPQRRRPGSDRHRRQGRRGSPARLRAALAPPRREGDRGRHRDRRHRRLCHLQQLLQRRLRLRQLQGDAEAAAGRLQGDRRHRPRPGRRLRLRFPRQLRDPARRQAGPGDRPEADPRRLEAARGDGDLPLDRQEPDDGEPRGRRGPAALQGGAAAPRARTTRGSRSTPAGGPTSPAARSTGACWRRWSTWPRRASG